MDFLPIPEEKLVINSAMGHQRQDYEAFYTLSPDIWLSEIHNHNFYEIYFHLHGGRTLYVNGHIYTLEPGCLMIFPPFQLHGIIQKEVLRDYERAVLYITPELLHTLGCGLMDFERLLLAPSDNGHYQFHMDADALQYCIMLLQTIAKNADDNSPQAKLQDYANMISLLLAVCKVIGNGQNALASQPVNDTVRQVLAYIQENYAEPLSLETLAAHFNISRSTLSHAFSQSTNSSVYDYVLFCRVTHAKELLATGIQPAEAAFQCGFGDYSSFLRTFKKMTGLSPRAFQQLMSHGGK